MANQVATKVLTGKVRLSFVHIFQPRQMPGSTDAKYQATLLIPKSDKETLNKIKSAIEAARLNSAGLFNGKIPASLKNTLKDGDAPKEDGSEMGAECKGHYVITVSSKTKPIIVDRQNNEIIDSTEVYSGCYARCEINFFAYKSNGNMGITAGLNGVQKLADGEPLGGRGSAATMFGAPIEDDDDDLGL